MDQVPPKAKDKLKALLKEYSDVFPDKLPTGQPPKRHIEHAIPIKEGEAPPNRPPYQPPYGALVLFVLKKMVDGGCAWTTMH